jgi:transcription initiation factor TFIIIB Brf1 subunit/transcription initiation factor TFIIB
MCHYQLVAGACLLIASKCSEHSISSNDISFCSDNLFNADQVTGTEDFILRQLDWKLAFPTSLAFMISYTRLLGIDSDSQVFLMMRYVVELALQSPIYLTYKPSMIAASAVVLARCCMQESEIWSEALEQETSYSLNDLCNCTMELSGLLENIRATMPELIMISRRYRKSSRQSVASISIPSISSFDSLVSYHESFFRRQSNGIPA